MDGRAFEIGESSDSMTAGASENEDGVQLESQVA
jgi:hypothetical protein